MTQKVILILILLLFSSTTFFFDSLIVQANILDISLSRPRPRFDLNLLPPGAISEDLSSRSTSSSFSSTVPAGKPEEGNTNNRPESGHSKAAAATATAQQGPPSHHRVGLERVLDRPGTEYGDEPYSHQTRSGWHGSGLEQQHPHGWQNARMDSFSNLIPPPKVTHEPGPSEQETTPSYRQASLSDQSLADSSDWPRPKITTTSTATEKEKEGDNRVSNESRSKSQVKQEKFKTSTSSLIDNQYYIKLHFAITSTPPPRLITIDQERTTTTMARKATKPKRKETDSSKKTIFYRLKARRLSDNAYLAAAGGGYEASNLNLNHQISNFVADLSFKPISLGESSSYDRKLAQDLYRLRVNWMPPVIRMLLLDVKSICLAFPTIALQSGHDLPYWQLKAWDLFQSVWIDYFTTTPTINLMNPTDWWKLKSPTLNLVAIRRFIHHSVQQLARPSLQRRLSATRSLLPIWLSAFEPALYRRTVDWKNTSLTTQFIGLLNRLQDTAIATDL